jgi:hypothetical protein
VTWYGTAVTTPEISANVNIKTEIANDDSFAADCTLVNTVVDPQGRELASIKKPPSGPSQIDCCIDQTTVPILYPAVVSVPSKCFAGWCDGVPDTGIYRDVQPVKAAGLDFIRGSHYSHSPKFAAACDQLV